MGWNWEEDKYDADYKKTFEHKKETWEGSPIPVAKPKPPKLLRHELIGHERFIGKLRELSTAGWEITKVQFAKHNGDYTYIHVYRLGKSTQIDLNGVYLKDIYEK